MKKILLKPGKQIVCWMVVALVSFSLTTGFSQSLDDPPSDEETDEPDAPLDGGLSLLLAAGAALGGKKVYEMRKKKNN